MVHWKETTWDAPDFYQQIITARGKGQYDFVIKQWNILRGLIAGQEDTSTPAPVITPDRLARVSLDQDMVENIAQSTRVVADVHKQRARRPFNSPRRTVDDLLGVYSELQAIYSYEPIERVAMEIVEPDGATVLQWAAWQEALTTLALASVTGYPHFAGQSYATLSGLVVGAEALQQEKTELYALATLEKEIVGRQWKSTDYAGEARAVELGNIDDVFYRSREIATDGENGQALRAWYAAYKVVVEHHPTMFVRGIEMLRDYAHGPGMRCDTAVALMVKSVGAYAVDATKREFGASAYYERRKLKDNSSI